MYQYSCIILNFILLTLLSFEMYYCYDIILDSNQSFKVRKKYAIRLIVSCVMVGIALAFIYSLFGVNGSNLLHYIEHGTV